jgi:hypothetical protein
VFTRPSRFGRPAGLGDDVLDLASGLFPNAGVPVQQPAPPTILSMSPSVLDQLESFFGQSVWHTKDNTFKITVGGVAAVAAIVATLGVVKAKRRGRRR